MENHNDGARRDKEREVGVKVAGSQNLGQSEKQQTPSKICRFIDNWRFLSL